MKLKIGFLVFILLLILLLVSCKVNDKIEIGFIATLTGTDSNIGIAMRDGLQLKIDEINADGGIGGKMLSLVIRDDKNDHDLIKKINQEFVDQGLLIIFGHELSSKVQAMTEATKDEQVILISPTLSTFEMSGLDDNFYRTITSNFDQGRGLGMDANAKYSNTLVIYDAKNETFAEGVYQGYSSVFSGKHESYAVTRSLTEVGQEICDIVKKGDYDSVLYILNPNDTMFMSQLLYKNKIRVQIFSSNWGMATNTLDRGGQAIEGAHFVSLLGDLENENYRIFRRNYFEKYNKEPEFAAIYAYESGILMYEALRTADNLTYQGIKDRLDHIGTVKGLLSDFTLDAYGDVSRSVFIAVVKEGKLIIE
ncbi:MULTISPECIES: ABC transporter substrate-binding protein [unclassified Fusibacter]|uniref:ABC transporter substrate-binding protein n=1 Tax=unclassified Fusibacter TaxID=2624464 RepID=UPI001012E111|nr:MULTISPECIES: ABC transporter substrate-binding protein [unclassified Fusibacter]MCK8058447.1 ABC transporter substrate-binding protein [Fusibacter sp. A2]NPE22785.1 amino acid ABC transporter substrate-binding protein [Fusibacter sp. A1]RXV60341.1 amino acid ABC transporter substrate-binding protein [Fusibacter sp. A1]